MTLDLAKLRPLVEVMAAERTKGCPWNYDDAVQEGLISAWRASQSHEQASPVYIHGAARKGVAGAVLGRAPFGHESRRGWQDAASAADRFPEDFDVIDPTGNEVLEKVETEYSCQAVRREVSRLPVEDQAIIHARFVKELDWKDVGRLMGRHPEALRRRTLGEILPTLRERLGGVS